MQNVTFPGDTLPYGDPLHSAKPEEEPLPSDGRDGLPAYCQRVANLFPALVGEQSHRASSQEQSHCAWLGHGFKRNCIEMSDGRADVRDTPTGRIDGYEMGHSAPSRYEIITIEYGTIEGESGVIPPARWCGGGCDMSVHTRCRVVGPVLAWYWRAVKDAAAADCQAAALGERRPAGANLCALACAEVNGVQISPARRTDAIQMARLVEGQIRHRGGAGSEGADYVDQSTGWIDGEQGVAGNTTR